MEEGADISEEVQNNRAGSRKSLYIVLVAFFAILIVLGIFLYFKSPTLPSEGLNCKTILSNGEPDGKIDIVFFFNGVSEKEADDYISYIDEVEPFKANKDKFNFYSVNYNPSCNIQNGILICYSRELMQASSVCPNDYVIVLTRQSASIRSSAYTNLMSLNVASQKSVLIHEFGHVFANLADEYVPSTIPRGSKNCVSSCDSFKSGNQGCFKGCSKDSYYRPVETGVMRTLSTSNYGAFDEKIVQENLAKYV